MNKNPCKSWSRDDSDAVLFYHDGGAFSGGQAFISSDMKERGRKGVYIITSGGRRQRWLAASWESSHTKMRRNGWLAG